VLAPAGPTAHEVYENSVYVGRALAHEEVVCRAVRAARQCRLSVASSPGCICCTLSVMSSSSVGIAADTMPKQSRQPSAAVRSCEHSFILSHYAVLCSAGPIAVLRSARRAVYRGAWSGKPRFRAVAYGKVKAPCSALVWYKHERVQAR